MLSLSKPCPGLDPGTKGEGTGRGTLDPRDKPEDDSIHHCHPGRSAQARRAGILSEAYDVEQTAKIPDRHALRMASGMTGGAVGAQPSPISITSGSSSREDASACLRLVRKWMFRR
jgi:hypothetical protein